MHQFLLHNGEVRETSAKLLEAGQVGVLNGWGVFSTLRVYNGVLFAFERHWARMARDARLLRVPMPWDANAMERQLMKLVEANQATNATLRVAVVRNKGGAFQGPAIERDADLIAFTKDLNHWGESATLSIQPQARHAQSPFAGTKVLSWCFNLVMYEQATASGFDEVVLLNERDEVSECTSANIFVSQGDYVSTPPLNSGCLPGITRELLLEVVRVPGITVEERPLRLEDLERADGVFITSTTRDLLPVRSVAGLHIRQESSALPRLRKAFSEYARSYVSASTTGAAVSTGTSRIS
jgi:branched-chain amino acid aminotransferase